jgi:hypothetical protein
VKSRCREIALPNLEGVSDETQSIGAGGEITMQPLDPALDHVRGAPGGRLLVEYGD